MTKVYSNWGLTRVLYAVWRAFDILVLIFLRTKPSVRLVLLVIRLTCGFQEREPEISKIICTCDRVQCLAMHYVISFYRLFGS